MALQLYWQSPPPWLAIVTRPASVVVTRAPTINKIITAIHFNAPICPSFSHLCHLFTSTKWKSTPNKKSGLLFDNKEKEEQLVKAPTNDNKVRRVSRIKGVRWPHLASISPFFEFLASFSSQCRRQAFLQSVVGKHNTKSPPIVSLVTYCPLPPLDLEKTRNFV